MKHPGEKLTSLQFGLLWGLAAFIGAVAFFAGTYQEMSLGIEKLLVVLISVFAACWMPFARRHPYAALAISLVATADAQRVKRKMDARRAADHEAFVSAQRHEELLRAMNPHHKTDYSGPAGFGRY